MRTPALDALRCRVRTPALDAVSRRVRRLRARDDAEPDYNRLIKSKGGIEFVEVMRDDPNYMKGQFAVYGPGGWTKWQTRSKAEEHYRWLVEEYAS